MTNFEKTTVTLRDVEAQAAKSLRYLKGEWTKNVLPGRNLILHTTRVILERQKLCKAKARGAVNPKDPKPRREHANLDTNEWHPGAMVDYVPVPTDHDRPMP